MLKKVPITRKFADLPAFEALYKTAFPTGEQAPLWLLYARAKKPNVAFDAYYDGEIFAGFTYVLTHKDITFVLYLAIDAQYRSKGYGSQILTYIREGHPNNRIVLTIELLDENAKNNPQRIKRKQFYLKNGYVESGFRVTTIGVDYELLCLGGRCAAQEFLTINRKFIGLALSLFVKTRITEME
ncbi:MAG: GNAT family N-acetyltransferase [Defluviitaleaceae bacterium]|nr:GNAT family N-acetyltransferase [Defluviitaleaceae bacterium]MCL2274358.1 GNAT family N-acetyltransferase [Defluviitaleaceae bacterium]